MITVIYAPPRTGKTCYMTHKARGIAFDRERTKLMQGEILSKQGKGFASLQTLPPHCVSANYNMTLHKSGYTPRYNRWINPFRLGYENNNVKTHFNLPYEAIFITEAQKYLNSRMSKYFPDWQSRWYEQHGHNNLDIWLDTQRPNLIDVNIRELAQFVEIVRMEKRMDGYGRVERVRWNIRTIANAGLYEKYMSSGKTDKSCYVESVEEADYNVFDCYDSQCCKPKFYQGFFEKDFDYSPALPLADDIEGYIRYLEEADDELPKKFYRKEVAKDA